MSSERNTSIYAPLVVIALLIASCVNRGPNSETTLETALQPAWVMNPEKPGFQSVVASAPKQDGGGRDAQYRVAIMKARQEMAQMVRVQVKSISRYETEDRSGKVSRHSDTETILSSKVALSIDDARVIAEWTDSKSGELYIWLVVPK